MESCVAATEVDPSPLELEGAGATLWLVVPETALGWADEAPLTVVALALVAAGAVVVVAARTIVVFVVSDAVPQAWPVGCCFSRLLITESIFDPEPLGPGG